MTAWGAGSLVQIVPTIQFSQTGETVVARKEALSAGIFEDIVRVCRSPAKLAVSWAYYRLQSPRSKIPFPAAVFPRANTLDVRGILESLGRKGAEL